MKSILDNLPIRLKLFIGMLIAANTAAIFTYLACKSASFEVDYMQALAAFLIYRVFAFMANKQMPLTDENVAFMSSERILWNLASFSVLLATWAITSSVWIAQKIVNIIALMI